MKISRAMAAPRIIHIGTNPVLISPPSLRDYGLIFNYLEDVRGRPEDADPEWTPDIYEDESQELLRKGSGMGIVLYVAMKRDQPETRLWKAYRYLSKINETDWEITTIMVLERAPRNQSKIDLSHWKKSEESETKSVNQINLGGMMEWARFSRFSPQIIAGWTLDQLENKAIGGEKSDEEIEREGVTMTEAEFARWAWRMRNDPTERARAFMARGLTPDVRDPAYPTWAALMMQNSPESMEVTP